jgi:hypothetical protein
MYDLPANGIRPQQQSSRTSLSRPVPAPKESGRRGARRRKRVRQLKPEDEGFIPQAFIERYHDPTVEGEYLQSENYECGLRPLLCFFLRS